MSGHSAKHSIHIISFHLYSHPDFTDEKLKHGVGTLTLVTQLVSGKEGSGKLNACTQPPALPTCLPG